MLRMKFMRLQSPSRRQILELPTVVDVLSEETTRPGRPRSATVRIAADALGHAAALDSDSAVRRRHQVTTIIAVRHGHCFLSAERQSEGHWYASGTFLAGAGIGVGVLGVVSSIWVILKAAAPRNTVWISILDVIPVGHKRLRVPEEAWVRRGAQALAKPHVANVRLTSKGRSDTRREAFDGGQGYRLCTAPPPGSVCLRMRSCVPGVPSVLF